MMRFVRSNEPVSFFAPDPENKRREISHHIFLPKKYLPQSIITLTTESRTYHYLVEDYTPPPKSPSSKPPGEVDLSAPFDFNSETTFVRLLTLDDYAEAVRSGKVEYSVAKGNLELSNNPANAPFRKKV